MRPRFTLRPPSDSELAAFARAASQTKVTAPADPDDSFVHDQYSVELGTAPKTWDRAREAIQTWAFFPRGWARVYPMAPPVTDGTVAVCFRALGPWWWSACRITSVFDEPDRFGFTYQTLEPHLECGSEDFVVERRVDAISFHIRAFSRPQHWLARLGRPIARSYQRRFAHTALDRMRGATR